MEIFPNKTTCISLTIIFIALLSNVEAKCKKGCEIALASYYVWEGSNLTYISKIFNQKIPEILRYNPQVVGPDTIQSGTRINVPFSCECLNGDFLGHTFDYVTQRGDTYTRVARFAFANLTTDYWIQRVNTYDPTQVPDFSPINVTVNCSCGDRHVSRDYGMFSTYPLRVGDSLQSLAEELSVPADLLQRYNQGSDFNAGSGIVFSPAKGTKKKMRFNVILVFIVLNILWAGVKSKCSEGCDSLASYYIRPGLTLTSISTTFSTTIDHILSYNPQITDPNLIIAGNRLNVPFSCGCLNNEFMGHQFIYQVRPGNTYQRIAELTYSNLTTIEMLTRFNSYEPGSIPEGARLNVTVNCSCGNSRVSREYGLFVTYPLRPGESLSAIANEFGLPERLLQDYNPGVEFNRGSGLVFIPGRGN
ncbi:hypothetical protein BUALT_Bualt18G0099100 [Buddleja alternifolia]|uniref:LysM domain-containing protein n=1 Tax=Buddleja alternifolia TaxID=168488 RepID=A0AAV6W4H2_9LAMI|nr:hypothetical protein BUALT_Bualt18G0099100 [Buddleja alternifolia]